jgi:hypothetical protein
MRLWAFSSEAWCSWGTISSEAWCSWGTISQRARCSLASFWDGLTGVNEAWPLESFLNLNDLLNSRSFLSSSTCALGVYDPLGPRRFSAGFPTLDTCWNGQNFDNFRDLK